VTVHPTMTSEAKRALAKTIRGLRGRLIEELGAAMERAYLLSIEAKVAQLDEAARVKRGRLESAIEEQVRALPKDKQAGAATRLRAEVVTDAAATLLLRLVYLRLLEANGLVAVKVVTGMGGTEEPRLSRLLARRRRSWCARTRPRASRRCSGWCSTSWPTICRGCTGRCA
jgi:hypothetical protein